MKIVMINKPKKLTYAGNSIDFSIKDYAVASYRLRVNQKSLKNLDIRILDNETYQDIINFYPPDNIGGKYYLRKNKYYLIFFVNAIDKYKILMKAYVMDKTLTPKEESDKLDAYFYEIQQNLSLYNTKFQQLVAAQKELKKENGRFYFFNADNFMNKVRTKGYKASIYKDLASIEFNNIKVGNENEGYLLYNKIIIFIKNFKIDGYLLRFEHFDFSSYWNMDEVSFHPNIQLPYGYNEQLSYLPEDDMDMYVESLISLVKDYKRNNGRMKSIIEDFNLCRKLWSSLKYDIEDRRKLSKAILKEEQKLRN